jgi:hypothetical protein
LNRRVAQNVALRSYRVCLGFGDEFLSNLACSIKPRVQHHDGIVVFGTRSSNAHGRADMSVFPEDG